MSSLSAMEISEIIKQRIAGFKVQNDLQNTGTVISISDGILRINGLKNVMQGELIALPNDRYALALNLERDSVGAVVLGDYLDLQEGIEVQGTGKLLSVPVGNSLLGRVVNALGQPIDGKGSIEAEAYNPIEVIAPGVIDRKSVDQPLQTGYLAVDSMVPIGRG